MDLRSAVFPGIMVLYGLFSLVFAFRQPSYAVAHFFRIPVIFLIFPESIRLPLGRAVMGLASIAFGVWLYIKLSAML
jgi:hypothetical protein